MAITEIRKSWMKNVDEVDIDDMDLILCAVLLTMFVYSVSVVSAYSAFDT